MSDKPDPGRVAEMRKRKPVVAPGMPVPDAAERDGRAPYLPDDCPVTALGKNGNKIFFLDRSQQIIEATTRCEKGDMMLWFGNDWLVDAFPRVKVEKGVEYPVPGEFDQREAQIALVEDCWSRGIFNPAGRVFGRGAHRVPGDEMQLILHMGSKVMRVNWLDVGGERRIEPQVVRAGRIDGPEGRTLFFPALEALPSPAAFPSTAAEGQALQAEFANWYWKHSQASTLLLLGMVGQMFLCGALDWRAHMWLSGPTASGKSSLQKLIRALLEDWCLHTEDASEAAVRQVLGDDTLPVMIDEAEAHDKPERLAAIINLMKKASSGAKIYRGSQDHKAQQFTAQSAFLFSSVLHPPFRGEDRNRLAILEMLPIPAEAPDLELDYDYYRRLGRGMRKRILEHWPRFDQTLSAYKAAIARKGYSGRWRDTYGTLLAFADLLMFDHPVSVNTAAGPLVDLPGVEPGPVRVERLTGIVAPAMALARTETRDDVERVLAYLSSLQLPGANGKPPDPVALWLERAMTPVPGEFPADPMRPNEEARARLKANGLRVMNLEQDAHGKWRQSDAVPDRWDEAWVAVAYASNRALCKLFEGSDWADGAWIQSLGKVPGAFKLGEKVRFAGSKFNPDRALMVPLRAFMGED